MIPLVADTSRRGRVQLPPTDEVRLYLIGTGGTGSHLAHSLARLAYHARTKGIRVRLTLVDPDRVEAKNVGRQLFCPAEIGQFKAETLALRLNAALGLAIRAVPRPIQALCLDLPSGPPDTVLVMGAVDNHPARQAIDEWVRRHRVWWCDSGNEAVAGRVYIGNALTPVQGLDALGWCRALPLPSLQDPALLEPESAPLPLHSCAELTMQDAQSLMINQLVASVAAQYATDFVLHRRFTTYRSVVSLDPPTVLSAPITDAALAAFACRTPLAG